MFYTICGIPSRLQFENCVKPGGLMRIGLYSEIARQHIVKVRSEINEHGIGSSSTEMRKFRNTLTESDQYHHKLVLQSLDFYSLSTLKDLLFHVKEHRFTIPQISGCLDELGLIFCGFDLDDVVSHFKLNYTQKNDLYNLEKWHSYEEVNPTAFSQMYQFWCQKVH